MKPLWNQPQPIMPSILLVVVILVGSSAWSAEADSLGVFEGRIIDSVIVETRNIYNTDDSRYDSFIFRTANKLHFVTRKQVVRRELLLKEGETYRTDLAEETARNLRARLVLYDAWVTPEELPDGRLLLRVVTIDQWSLSGGLIVGRDGNETELRIGIAERNLLGRNLRLDGRYNHVQDRSDYFNGNFADSRLFGQPLRFSLNYNGDPESNWRAVTLGRPFYNQMQRYSFRLSAGTVGGTRELYRDSELTAESDYDAELYNGEFLFRGGSYVQKIELGLMYTRRLETIGNKEIFSTKPQDSLDALEAFPQDSAYHRVGATLSFLNEKFVSLHRIDGFGYTEDYRLGPALKVDVSRAFESGEVVFDHVASSVVLSGRGFRTLASGSSEIAFWLDQSGNQIRRLVGLRAVLYNQSLDFVTFALHGSYRHDVSDQSSSALVLGGTTGLRGYDKYFRSGNRRAVVNLEGRVYPGIEFLSIQFGAVVFSDIGQIWKEDETLSLDRTYASIGAGLRISGERSSKTALFRFDLAYSESRGWQLSVGTKQFFSASPLFLPLTTY